MRGEREEAHGNLNCGRYTDRFAGFICFQEHRNRNTPREQEQVHGSHLGTRHAMFMGCSCVFLVGFTQEHPENTQEHVKNAIGDTTPHVPRCVPLRTRARGTGEQSPFDTYRVASTWCNLSFSCCKLAGSIRNSPRARNI